MNTEKSGQSQSMFSIVAEQVSGINTDHTWILLNNIRYFSFADRILHATLRKALVPDTPHNWTTEHANSYMS